jgi:hypothetical protein
MLSNLELPRELGVKRIYTSNGQREAQRMANISDQRGEVYAHTGKVVRIEILYQIVTPIVGSLLSQL